MKQPASPSHPQKTTPRPNGERSALPIYNSQDLFGEGSLIYIDHQGERYRLQQTRQGKLILTK